MLAEQQPYQLDPQALADLDLEPDEVDELVGVLALAGDLSAELTVPEDRVAYFVDVRHALEFTVEGFEDYARDVFFLLHAVAKELSLGTAEILARLGEQADKQRRTLVGALQDAFGIPADTVEAICMRCAVARRTPSRTWWRRSWPPAGAPARSPPSRPTAGSASPGGG